MIKKIGEIKPLVINTLDRVRKEKIALKQLLLWSHRTHLFRTKTCGFCLKQKRKHKPNNSSDMKMQPFIITRTLKNQTGMHASKANSCTDSAWIKLGQSEARRLNSVRQNRHDTRVNSTRTLPLNIFTCAWKTEKPCKLQYNSLTVFWLVSLWCNWVQMSCSLSVAYW